MISAAEGLKKQEGEFQHWMSIYTFGAPWDISDSVTTGTRYHVEGS